MDGVFPNHSPRVGKFHPRELGGMLRQGFNGNSNAWRNSATEIGAFGGDSIEGGGRPEINDDDLATKLVIRSNGVDEAISPHFFGTIGEDGDPRSGMVNNQR